MKFTFKIVKVSPWTPTFTDIKIKKRRCGIILQESSGNKCKIQMMVEKNEKYDDKNPNCKWMNIVIKRDLENEEAARTWLQENIENIMKKYPLHFHED